jgi:dephospho-CoA kinase
MWRSIVQPVSRDAQRSAKKTPPPDGGGSPAKQVIGVLGGIGSGKSQVAAALARYGGRVINADLLGHEALRQPEIRQRIVERWGKELLDEQGQIVRRRVAAIVFRDSAELRALEEIVHPWIGQAIREEIARNQADPAARFTVLDAAVMLEAGWHSVCQRLLFVDVPREVRWQRLAQQRGWTPKQVQQRENAQLPLTEKAARADHVLDNSGTPEQLERQVRRLLGDWRLAPVPEDGRTLEPPGVPSPSELPAVDP